MATSTDSGIYSVLDDERINGRSALFQAYNDGIDGSWATSLYTEIDSDSEIENYNWLGTAPKMQEWGSEFKYSEVPNYNATLRNRDWQSGELVKKGDIRRDKTGQVRTLMGQLGSAAATHPEEVFSTMLVSSETAGGTDLYDQAWDGQAFFDTDHSYTGAEFTTNQTNDLTASEVAALNVSTATAPTADEMASVIVGMVTHFYTLKDDRARPINANLRNFTIMAGTGPIAAAAAQAVTRDNLTSGATNPVQGLNAMGVGGINVILNPRLSALTTKVFIFSGDGALRPFIYQDEVGLNVWEIDPGQDQKYIKVGANKTGGFGFARWQSALIGTLS